MLSNAHTILDAIQKWSAVMPFQPAVLFLPASGEMERISYSNLAGRVQKRASLLRQLPLYSRIGLVAPHGPAFLVDALAILAAGHCLVPISGKLPAGLRDEMIERAGVHALLEFGKPDLKLCAGKAIDQADDEAFRAICPAYLRFTSGSTGQRKGVLLGHQTILDRTAAANKRLNISPKDKVLCLLPMVDHFAVSILLYLRYGATVVLVENEAAASQIALAENVTVIYGAPLQYRRFTQLLPNLRLAVSTTQGLSQPIADQFLAQTGKPLTQALGIIEAGLITLNEDRAATEPLLAGKPMPDYRITIVSQEGPAGEIHIAGPGLVDAYVSPWRPRASLVGPCGFPTGDHGWMDDTGCLHLVGREKNRIHLEGESFFCEEVEAIINQHPAVQESLVSLENNSLSAQIVTQPLSADAPMLSAWLSQKLPGPQVPAQIRIVDELPRTPTGKLARPSITQRISIR